MTVSASARRTGDRRSLRWTGRRRRARARWRGASRRSWGCPTSTPALLYRAVARRVLDWVAALRRPGRGRGGGRGRWTWRTSPAPTCAAPEVDQAREPGRGRAGGAGRAARLPARFRGAARRRAGRARHRHGGLPGRAGEALRHRLPGGAGAAALAGAGGRGEVVVAGGGRGGDGRCATPATPPATWRRCARPRTRCCWTPPALDAEAAFGAAWPWCRRGSPLRLPAPRGASRRRGGTRPRAAAPALGPRRPAAADGGEAGEADAERPREAGSGTATGDRKPRISPLGKRLVWMLR